VRVFYWLTSALLGVAVSCGIGGNNSTDRTVAEEVGSGAKTARITADQTQNRGSTGSGTAFAEAMYEPPAPRLHRSAQGLPVEHRADGLTTVKLQGRFRHLTLARRMPDGTVKLVCVDDPGAAARLSRHHSHSGEER
jgi:hypothetical protein